MFKKEKNGDRRKITLLGVIKISYRKFDFFEYMRSRPKCFPVCLTENEKNFFIRHIRDSKNYLEFGTGGSTFLTLLNSKAKVTGVDSDNAWLNYLRKWLFIKKNEWIGRLKFAHIDIGQVKEWGFPVDESYKDKWGNYSREIFRTIDCSKIDTVLIDGRFRVACALNVLLHCNENIKIIIHDFHNRPEYQMLLDYMEIIDDVDTIAAFKIKESVNANKINGVLEAYSYDYR